jgi:hypothetical protein
VLRLASDIQVTRALRDDQGAENITCIAISVNLNTDPVNGGLVCYLARSASGMMSPIAKPV